MTSPTTNACLTRRSQRKLAGLRSWLLGSALVIAGAVNANETMPLGWAADGTLEGLPGEFGAARPAVEFAEGRTGALRTLTLYIAGKRTALKPCLLGELKSRSQQQIDVGAWWSRQEPTQTPYLEIMFFDDDFDPRSSYNANVNLRFDLKSGRLLDGQRWTRSWWRSGMVVEDLDFRKICPD